MQAHIEVSSSAEIDLDIIRKLVRQERPSLADLDAAILASERANAGEITTLLRSIHSALKHGRNGTAQRKLTVVRDSLRVGAY